MGCFCEKKFFLKKVLQTPKWTICRNFANITGIIMRDLAVYTLHSTIDVGNPKFGPWAAFVTKNFFEKRSFRRQNGPYTEIMHIFSSISEIILPDFAVYTLYSTIDGGNHKFGPWAAFLKKKILEKRSFRRQNGPYTEILQIFFLVFAISKSLYTPLHN